MLKKLASPLLVIIGVVGAVCGVVYLSNMYMTNQKNEKSAGSAACAGTNSTSHLVVIKDGVVTPETTNATRCDMLTIINNDSKTREIAFGQHDNHIEYGGVSEKPVAPGESLTITLDKLGEYIFHDHYQEEVGGTFSVKER